MLQLANDSIPGLIVAARHSPIGPSTLTFSESCLTHMDSSIDRVLDRLDIYLASPPRAQRSTPSTHKL